MIILNRLFTVILLVSGWGGFFCAVYAQDSDLRPVSSTYALTNATIIQAPGRVIENGTIVMANGVITSIGRDVSIPATAVVIRADSMYIYAGFIAGLSNIGVEKPKNEEQKDDRKLTGMPTYERAGITPDVNVRDLLKNTEKSIESYRELGFTAAQTVPHSGMMAGKGGIILLGGYPTSKSMLLKENTTLFSQLVGANGVYPNTVIGVMAKYRDLYKKAVQAKAYQARYESDGNGMERPHFDKMLTSLYPVVSRQMPVSFRAEDALDILRVLALKQELGFNLALAEVKQGWDIIPQIKATGASVFFSLDLPEWVEEKEPDTEGEEEEMKEDAGATDASRWKRQERELLEKRKKAMIKNYYTQPSVFVRHGVKFGFSTLGAKPKDFKKNMINIIGNGLSEDQALAALTTYPSEVLGVASVMGTIDRGKLANLIVTDGAYFDEKSSVRYVFVDGVKYEYEARQKQKTSDEEDVDPVGAWSYSAQTPEGELSGVITITKSGGSYEGTVSLSYNQSTNDIVDLLVDGSTVSFSFTTNVPENITVAVSMKVEGDTFEGTIFTDDFGSFPMEGFRDPD